MPGTYIFEFTRWPRSIFSSPSGESTWHVALKLMAYLIYRQRNPLVERSVGQRYKPDLVVVRDGRVRLWIDCGETSLQKLARVVLVNSVARVVIVKDTLKHLDSYMMLADAVLRDQQRVLYLAFEDGLVDGVAHSLRQRNQLDFTVSGGNLSIQLNGDRFTGALFSRRTASVLPTRHDDALPARLAAVNRGRAG